MGPIPSIELGSEPLVLIPVYFKWLRERSLFLFASRNSKKVIDTETELQARCPVRDADSKPSYSCQAANFETTKGKLRARTNGLASISGGDQKISAYLSQR